MNKQERQTLRIQHALSCATCGPLDTPQKFMGHLYAMRGTTFEKEVTKRDQYAKAFVEAWAPICKELNTNFAIAHGLPLTDEELK